MSISKIFFICALFICSNLNAQYQIKELTTQKGVSIRAMSVPSEKVIWASGSKGMVAKSTNEGLSFEWMQVKGYEQRIDSVQTKIDSAQVINKQIDVKIDSVKENVVSITKEIHHIDNTLTIVKKQTDEKINTVDKFSNAELEFFFTNRYNESNTTN